MKCESSPLHYERQGLSCSQSSKSSVGWLGQ